jgi:hypothetical protein
MDAVSFVAAIARLSKDADATFHKTITIRPDAKTGMELAMSRTAALAYSQTLTSNSDKRTHASVNVSLASIIRLARLAGDPGQWCWGQTVPPRTQTPSQVIGSER